MEIEILRNADEVAQRAANFIAKEADAAISERGRFTLALSGGRSPSGMLRALAVSTIDWERTFLFQIDERVVPLEHPDRNLTQLKQSLLDRIPLHPDHVYPMPVEMIDLEAAALEYSAILERVVGAPPMLDLVHLGLGRDGHTASLVPHDPVLEVTDRDVASTALYQGRRRLTMTYSLLNRARRVLWMVTGSDKRDSLKLLLSRDPSIPAARIRSDRAIVLADRDASG